MDKELEKEMQRHSDWVRGYMDGLEQTIIRCEECKHKYIKTMGFYCSERVHPLAPDGYCERGERE